VVTLAFTNPEYAQRFADRNDGLAFTRPVLSGPLIVWPWVLVWALILPVLIVGFAMGYLLVDGPSTLQRQILAAAQSVMRNSSRAA
jgi:hypothetical protein